MSGGLRWRDGATPTGSKQDATLLMGSDRPVGSAEPVTAGRPVDIVVLSQDRYKTSPDAVGRTSVLPTRVEGKIVCLRGI